MQYRHTALLVVGVAFALVASACSSSDNKGSTGLNSGLESKTLSSLTQPEVDQLNKAIADYVAGKVTKAQSCKAAGALAAGAATATGTITTDAALQAACTQGETQCNADTTTDTSNNVTMAQLANCSATVQELETCVTDETAAGLTALNSVPACSALTLSSLGSLAPLATQATAASCTAFDTKCPDVRNDTTGVTGG
jgi:hypothetical protein